MSISAGALLQTLESTWRELARQDEHETLRACATTILILTRPEDDPRHLGSVLAEVMHEYPSRAVLLHFPEESGTPMEARATVQCWLPFGRRQQICSEQIEIQAPRDRAHHIPPVLRGLLVPDLPVFLWCRDLSLMAVPPLAPLFGLAGRIIVDSVPYPDAREPFQTLAALRQQGYAFSDLGWTRVTRWRALLDRVFQTSACRAGLRAARHAAIGWSGAGTPAVACYLGAWLRSHLPDLELTMEIEDPQFPPPGTGRIRRLAISGDRFQVEIRRPTGTMVEVTGGGLRQQLMFPLFQEADLLREELAILGRDQRFESSLPDAMRLAGVAA
jgi:hypothetical protein